jgi:hypothetical protein
MNITGSPEKNLMTYSHVKLNLGRECAALAHLPA